MQLAPFTISVSDEVLADLRARLANTRFASRAGSGPWSGGADPDYLRDLVAYWADGFDWRRQERRLNAFDQYLVEVGGRAQHFVRLNAAGPADAGRPPLLLLHGWPSSFVEMLPLAERLSDPGRHGGDPADAFDVVVPSMPGFLYSDPTTGPATRAEFAAAMHSLMADVLGADRYGVFGGDIGATVAGWLGATRPEHVVGVHLIHPPFPAGFDDPPPSEPEQAFLDAEEAYDETDGGYSSIQVTRPDTLAAALLDSPAGLVAWIADKYRDWADCDGDITSRFDHDTLLTIATLYWVTGSIGSSFRPYYDFRHNTPRPDITVPTAFTLSNEPSMKDFPRSIAERCCTDIRLWHEPGKGGHFMPLEEPDPLARDLRGFFTAVTR